MSGIATEPWYLSSSKAHLNGEKNKKGKKEEKAL